MDGRGGCENRRADGRKPRREQKRQGLVAGVDRDEKKGVRREMADDEGKQDQGADEPRPAACHVGGQPHRPAFCPNRWAGSENHFRVSEPARLKFQIDIRIPDYPRYKDGVCLRDITPFDRACQAFARISITLFASSRESTAA